MIQPIATFIISIIIISTLIELLLTFVYSLFKSSNKSDDGKIKYYPYISIDPIWYETTKTITYPVLFRRNYYSENLKTLRRYKYKHKYNKIW